MWQYCFLKDNDDLQGPTGVAQPLHLLLAPASVQPLSDGTAVRDDVCLCDSTRVPKFFISHAPIQGQPVSLLLFLVLLISLLLWVTGTLSGLQGLS